MRYYSETCLIINFCVIRLFFLNLDDFKVSECFVNHGFVNHERWTFKEWRMFNEGRLHKVYLWDCNKASRSLFLPRILCDDILAENYYFMQGKGKLLRRHLTDNIWQGS